MELDRTMWNSAVTRVHRVARIAQGLWWVFTLAPPIVALVAFPGLLVEALLAGTLSLLLMHRVAFAIGAGRIVSSLHTLIRTSGPDLTRNQVVRLLLDGMAPGDGEMWMTIHEDTHVRLIAEGREPGKPPRSSSPWVWAMGGGGT